MIREQTYASVNHPDPFVFRGRVLTLITDPMADRIQTGDPTLGWEGDPRFALYLDVMGFEWQLWRLEADGVYRCSKTLPGTIRGIDAVGMLILWLVESDQRKGFNLIAKLDAERARADREKAQREYELEAETSDRLDFALKKDGVV